MTRIIDSGNYNALVAAPESGGIYRDLVTIFARPINGGSAELFCFWNGIGTYNITVIDPKTGLQVVREYHGDGSLLSVEPIIFSQGLVVKTYQFKLSPIHTTVRNMYSGKDIRGARVEMHRLQIIPLTNEPAGPAMVEDVGLIDKAPLTLEGVAAESSIDIEVANRIRALTKTSSAKKSDAWTRLNRQGDKIRQYNDTANVKIWWGQAKDKPGSGGNSTSSNSGGSAGDYGRSATPSYPKQGGAH